jgi:hypothetical protein
VYNTARASQMASCRHPSQYLREKYEGLNELSDVVRVVIC